MSKFDAFLYDETKTTRRIKIATTAMRCERNAWDNRTRIAVMIEAVMQQQPDVELILFGEMILGWYMPGKQSDYHRQISEPIPGETTQTLVLLAQKFGIYICLGISELDGDRLYNSQVLLNPQGEIQVVHRKSNLKPGEVDGGYQPGSAKVTATEIKGIKTGLVICSDTASPRTMWALMRGKFGLILHSLADDDRDDFVTKFQARMYDAWFVTANRFGQENGHFWPGLITVTDPLGAIRSAAQGQEQFLVYELHLAEAGSWFKRAIRNIWVKAPLIVHVIKNWKQARSYL
ncbi:MAG: carbon-nitrogen hydrolase family protein [Anaerolineae bacterium]|nr:carbon-nitrogen hydrolase family protein [Anaerolineae bacterium]